MTVQNTSKLAVHATFSLLNSVTSDVFMLDPTSMLLEPGQKQASFIVSDGYGHSLNQVPASAGVRRGKSPLPGGS